MIPGVEKVEGNVKTKRLEVQISEEAATEDVVRMMEQIGFPVED